MDVLATMERDAQAFGGAVAHTANADWSPPARWSLPSGLTDLPAELRVSAEIVLASQQRAIDALEQQMVVAGRHLTALESIPSRVASAGTAAYLDVVG